MVTVFTTMCSICANIATSCFGDYKSLVEYRKRNIEFKKLKYKKVNNYIANHGESIVTDFSVVLVRSFVTTKTVL